MDINDGASVAGESLPILSESAYQTDYQTALARDNLDASTFTYQLPAYQVLAKQSNSQVEQILNLVHTTESMMRPRMLYLHCYQMLVMTSNMLVKMKKLKRKVMMKRTLYLVVNEDMMALLP